MRGQQVKSAVSSSSSASVVACGAAGCGPRPSPQQRGHRSARDAVANEQRSGDDDKRRMGHLQRAVRRRLPLRPSIIRNADGSFDMWTCSPGRGSAW